MVRGWCRVAVAGVISQNSMSLPKNPGTYSSGGEVPNLDEQAGGERAVRERRALGIITLEQRSI